MRKRPFFWNILPLFLVVTIISGALLFTFAVNGFRLSYSKVTEKRLKEQAIILSEMLVVSDSANLVNINSIINKVSESGSIRFTIIDLNGKVLADNRSNPEVLDNHRDRPEIIKAYNGEIGISVRYSESIKRELMYVAVPVSNDIRPFVVRASLPLISVTDAIKGYSFRLTIAYLVILFMALISSIVISRRVAKPLESLTEQAQRFAEGNLSRSFRNYPNSETERLAESMNRMADELDERIKVLTYRKNMQRAVFSSMYEGVVAVDSDEKIILINRAAAEIFELFEDDVIGCYLQEVVRNTRIQKFVNQLMLKNLEIDKEVMVISSNEQERYIQFHGATLKDEDGEGKGAVFVMHDITDLKRMEMMRREFVANVSHELRTPLTAIKGFVETLEDGAMNDEDESKHFLGIIAKHVGRLNTIIEDLLTISRLEKDENESAIELSPVSFSDIYSNVIEVCKPRAEDKHVTIKADGNISNTVFCSSQLLEQAVINLIDNAIKYSPAKGLIVVTCESNNDNILIKVKDEGQGIPSIHLPRLFERFYRVDKARSRTAGGTGLGLSIVKHIVNLHNGSVDVESAVGKGSTFTIRIPEEKKGENGNV